MATVLVRVKTLIAAFVVVLLAVSAAFGLAVSPAFAATAAERAALAQWWAPVHFQDVDTTGNTSLAGKSDYLSSYDFDGDLNGRNNWENTSQYPLAAHVYYSVVQTSGFTYLVYMFFHPRDWSDGSLSDYEADLSEHENDSEGVLVIVKNDGTTYGKLEAAITVAHKDFYSYVPSGSDFSSGAEDIDGLLATTTDPHDADQHQRPWTAAQSKSHAAWSYGATRAPSPALQTQYKSGDGVLYYPGSTAEVPSNANDRDVQYTLTDIFAPGGMRDNRTNTSLFATTSAFAGDSSSNPYGAKCGAGAVSTSCDTNSANPPWAWDDQNDLPGSGAIATDPSYLVWDYFSWSGRPSTAESYTYNPYQS